MNDKVKNKQSHQKRKLRVGRLLLLIMIVVGSLIGCFCLGQMAFKMFFTEKVPVVAINDDIGKDETLNRRINVLLLGIDDGDSEDFDKPKRTDAMIVASFDPDNNEVAILSIPRDTRVKIPGRQWPDKINSAFAYGGVTLAKQTVANLLQIPIHYYVIANWQGFIDIVDILGGVDMYVDHNMNYEDPYADLKIHIKQGYQHLDGKTSGEYVRFRHDELGDIGRVQRQQKFLRALAGEFFNVGNMVKLPVLMRTLDKYVDTDMDVITMIRAANSFKLFGSEKIKSEMLYGDFKTIDEISYWQTNPRQIERTLDTLKIPHKEIVEN